MRKLGNLVHAGPSCAEVSLILKVPTSIIFFEVYNFVGFNACFIVLQSCAVIV